MVANWKTVPISELYEGIFDGPHATPKPSSEGPVFLGIGNVTDDGHLDLSDIRHIAEEDFAKWTRRVEPRPGDIVFTYEATLNRYAIIPQGFRGCLGRRMALIRANPQKVDTRFLFYYFFSPAWREVIKGNMMTGATVDRIPLITFPNFQVRVPPLPVQKRIAGILSAYDELIENSQRRIKILEAMARALYREWFVHFHVPAQVLTKAGLPPIQLTNSPLGPIPRGWEVGRLEDVLVLQRGFDLPKAERVDGNVPIFAATGVTGFHNEAKVKAPGIVTGRSGTIGDVIYVQEDFWPLNTSLWVKEFPKSEPLYAYYLLASLDLGQFNSGAAVPTLNRNDIHGLGALIPPHSLQRRFQQVAGVMLRQARTHDLQIQNLRQTRDLLLPRLLSGQLTEFSGLDELGPSGEMPHA
ncbi:restriction endonuclease subunit S [bacterium]|nr:MAG: restriction endonuclease subunit S [bacterium]